MTAKQNKIESASKLNISIAETSVTCIAKQDNGKDVYQGTIESHALPWDDGEFVQKFITMGFKQMIYRSASAKKAIGLVAGEPVTNEMFIAAVRSMTFQGDAAPTKADKDQAQSFFNAIEAETFTWEQVEESIEEKYGWKLISRDLNGLIQHAFKARLKRQEANDLAGL